MPRGGRRNSKPNTAYPNRSDLVAQPVRTAPDQTYGAAGQQAAAQQQIPLPQTAPPANTPFVPPEPGMLSAPTTRPNEPVTAGLPIGPGPGPEAVGIPSQDDNALNDLKVIYAQYPTEQLRQIVERLEQDNGISARR